MIIFLLMDLYIFFVDQKRISLDVFILRRPKLLQQIVFIQTMHTSFFACVER